MAADVAEKRILRTKVSAFEPVCAAGVGPRPSPINPTIALHMGQSHHARSKLRAGAI